MDLEGEIMGIKRQSGYFFSIISVQHLTTVIKSIVFTYKNPFDKTSFYVI
jgi:hypothetical protein